MTGQTLFQRYHFSTTQKLEALPRLVARSVNADVRVVEATDNRAIIQWRTTREAKLWTVHHRDDGERDERGSRNLSGGGDG